MESYPRISLSTVLAVVALTLTTATLGVSQGTWTSLTPIPSPTEGMTVGGVGDLIIGAYGYSFGDTNTTRLFNIKTNTWTTGAAAPLPVRSEMAYGDTTHGGFLYVIGGRNNETGTVLSNLERYDPLTNTWTTLAPMSVARAGAAAAVVDNGIYVIGGRDGTSAPCTGTAFTAVERYDIDSNTWSSRAPLPSPRSDLAATAHGGKIYVFGGCAGPGTFLSDVDKYDPGTDTWTASSPMPTPRASLAAGKVGPRVYANGGMTSGSDFLTVNEVFDINTELWGTSALPSMPTGRSEAGAYSHGGKIFVVGGGPHGVSTAANEVFKPHP